MLAIKEYLIFRCLECKKTRKNVKKDLIKKFANIYKFCNGDINKFILLLRKGICPYEKKKIWLASAIIFSRIICK